MDNLSLKKHIESSKREVYKQNRVCMAPNCDKIAIRSHVLQKNGILREISDNNHIYQFGTNSAFESEKKGVFNIKLIGINDAYTFPGFCREHDSSIFQSIEIKNQIENDLENTARLLSYRSLCHEIRRKEITKDFSLAVLNHVSLKNYYPQLHYELNSYAMGLLHGISNLRYFKNQFESEIFDEINKWEYHICELPRFEVCLSSPLNIKDIENIQSMNFDSNGKMTRDIFTTSVINLFPFKDKNYLMIAINKEYRCNWSLDLFRQIENSNIYELKQHVSDLISTRLEFWCMSGKVRQLISDKKFNKLSDIFGNEVLNHDAVINYNFNVFK